jgi:predicted HicB family RNase H-like nuclease
MSGGMNSLLAVPVSVKAAKNPSRLSRKPKRNRLTAESEKCKSVFVKPKQVYIPGELHDELKLLAHQLHLSLKSLVARHLQDVVKTYRDAGRLQARKK